MENKDVKALLISSGKYRDGDYLDYAKSAIGEFLGPAKQDQFVAFFPCATVDEAKWDSFTISSGEFFKSLGYGFVSVHEKHLVSNRNQHEFFTDPNLAAVFVSGGNTFSLVDRLRKLRLDDALQMYVRRGLKYIGVSAGTVMAGPNMGMTNDKAIVFPTSPKKKFTALRIINVQPNVHFFSGPARPGYNGETRETQIEEFHYYHSHPVVGLPEGSWLRVMGNIIQLGGTEDAMLFCKGKEPIVWVPGEHKTFY